MVGRAVASWTSDPRFESSSRQFLRWTLDSLPKLGGLRILFSKLEQQRTNEKGRGDSVTWRWYKKVTQFFQYCPKSNKIIFYTKAASFKKEQKFPRILGYFCEKISYQEITISPNLVTLRGDYQKGWSRSSQCVVRLIKRIKTFTTAVKTQETTNQIQMQNC